MTAPDEHYECELNHVDWTWKCARKDLLADLDAARAENERLLEIMRENVGDAYNLLTQGESASQLRGPSARRIYDRSLAALVLPAQEEK